MNHETTDKIVVYARHTESGLLSQGTFCKPTSIILEPEASVSFYLFIVQW